MAYVVSPLEWDMTNMRDKDRMHRLLKAPSPSALVGMIVDDARSAVAARTIALDWEEAREKTSFFRAVAAVPIGRDNFDALFNGPNGYRAHYYAAEARGTQFNRTIIDALVPYVEASHQYTGLDVSLDIFRKSILERWSKIWVWNDTQVFSTSESAELRPKRWFESCSLESMSLRAPLPFNPAIDLKGTWLRPGDGEIWLSPDKEDRELRLHLRGHA